MKSLIACCSCQKVPSYSKDAFQIMFDGIPLPEMYVGIKEIRHFAESLAPKWNVTQYLLALAKSKEKYSYYFVYDENTGDVITQYDLLKGRKVL